MSIEKLIVSFFLIVVAISIVEVEIGSTYLDAQIKDNSEYSFDGEPVIDDGNTVFMASKLDSSFKYRLNNNSKKYGTTYAEVDDTLFSETMVYRFNSDDISRFGVFKHGMSGVEAVKTFNASTNSRISGISASDDKIILGFKKGISENERDRNHYVIHLDREGKVASKFEVNGKIDSIETSSKESIYIVSGDKILKYSLEGEKQWKKDLNYPDILPRSERSNTEIKIDGDNIYIGTTISNSRNAIALAKYSKNGNKQWSTKKELEGVKDVLKSLKISDNAVYLSGTVRSREPFIARDAKILKLSKDGGKTIWNQTFNINPESTRETVNKLYLTQEGDLKLFSHVKILEKLNSEPKYQKRNVIVDISSTGVIKESIRTKHIGSKNIYRKLKTPYVIDNSNIKALRLEKDPFFIDIGIDNPGFLPVMRKYYETEPFNKSE